MKNYRLLLPAFTFTIGPVLSYISLPFITNSVSVSDYGLYIYYLSLLSVVSFISLLPALNSTVNRYGNNESEQYSDDFFVIKNLYLLSFIVYFSSVMLLCLFHERVTAFEFSLIAISIFSVNIFNAIKSYLLINNDKSKYVLFVVLINLFQYVYLFYMLSHDDFTIVDILFGNLILILIIALYNIKRFFWLVKVPLKKTYCNSKITKFVGMSFAISLSTIIFNNTDKIMIEHLLNDSQSLAFYQVSYQIFAFPIESMYALISIFTPAFLYRAFDKDRELYLENFKITFKIVLFLIFILSQFLIVHKDYLKSLLLDSSYITSDSLPVLFLISQSLFLLYLVSTNIFVVYDKRLYIIISLSISSISNMVLNWYLIPSFGYTGAAISTLLSYLILIVVISIVSYRSFCVVFFDLSDVLFILSIPVFFYLFSDNYLSWVSSLTLVAVFYFIKNIKNVYLSFLRGV